MSFTRIRLKPIGHSLSRTSLYRTAARRRSARHPLLFILPTQQHVVFRGADNHVHELYWTKESNTWQATDLTRATNAPLPTGKPGGYAITDARRVAFRDNHGHIYELLPRDIEESSARVSVLR